MLANVQVLPPEMPGMQPPDAARTRSSERSRLSASSLLRVLRVRDGRHLPMAAAHRPQTRPTIAQLVHGRPGAGRYGPRFTR